MSSNQDADKQPSSLTSHAQKNRAMWEASSDNYDERHVAALSGINAMTWGLLRILETELQILGEVAGKDVLEYGCGAARWSIELARRGARPVGLDLSSRQLSHARRLMNEVGNSPGHTYISGGLNGQYVVDNGFPQGRNLRQTSDETIKIMYQTGLFILPPGVQPERW